MTQQQVHDFQEIIRQHYRNNARKMPWRDQLDPYYILVSEMMLQQTQVNRVVPKFNSFIAAFPDVMSLAEAPLSSVIEAWQGLGYNRRPKYLHEAARMIIRDYNGLVPSRSEDLVRLPGVGVNTAGAITTYAFNKPAVFIETNIRSVFLYHFFPKETAISDIDIHRLVQLTLDHNNPREWYWALMDYGAYLKTNKLGSIQASRAYRKQSAFMGSRRQIRGEIIKTLIKGPATTVKLMKECSSDEQQLKSIIDKLREEGLIARVGNKWCLTGSEGAS